MVFARQFYRWRESPELSRYINRDFVKRDPCLNCTLWECDEESADCKYIQITERRPTREDVYSDDELKADILAILRTLNKECTT